jgi:hypothetical protein
MRFIITFISFFLSFSFFSFAQTIPSDSLNYYKGIADSLFATQEYQQAILSYQNLAQSGNVESAYELYEIYHNGFGVEMNENEANRWLKLAKDLDTEFYEEVLPKAKNQQLYINDDMSPLNRAGALIEKGGRQNVTSICLGLIGGTIGGGLIGLGFANGNSGLTISGEVVCAVAGVTSLVLFIVGNTNIKKGGAMMRKIQFTGNGVNVKF